MNPMDSLHFNTVVTRIIKRLRLKNGLSQEDLAGLASLDRTYISGIERGRRNITLKSLEKIILALNLNTEDFIKELSKEISLS